MISASEIVHIFNYVEERYQASEIKYHGMHVWPIIRMMIGAKVQGRLLYGNSKEGKRVAFIGKIVNLLKCVRSIYCALVLDVRNCEKKRRNIDVVILAISQGKSRIGGKYYSSYTDPVFEAIMSKGLRVAVIERDKTNSFQFPRAIKSIYLNYYLIEAILLRVIQLIQYFLPREDTTDAFSGIKRVIEYCEEKAGIKLLSLSEVKNAIQRIESYKHYYLYLLKKIRPKIAIVHCYYSADAMGFILACRSISCRAVDYQHGVQGDYHYAYSQWKAVPRNGFNTIPEFFLTWTENDANRISYWGNPYHKASGVGNLWSIQCKLNKSGQIAIRRKLNELCENRKIVLLTLQNKLIEEWVWLAIKESKNDWFWLLRLHPMHRYLEKEVRNALDAKKISNAETKVASNFPLSLILANVGVHVTSNSSVVVEAYNDYRIRSVILDKIGEEYYSDLIAIGSAVYARDKSELMKALHMLYKDPELYQQTDDNERFLEQLRVLLQ